MVKNQYKSDKKLPFSKKDFQKLPKSIMILGVDEAGRGAWAGPVVAACVVWIGKCPIKTALSDSKKLNSKEREKTYQEIQKLTRSGKLSCGVGIIDNTFIDTVGIREANRRAIEIAMLGIKKTEYGGQRDRFIIIDGRDNYTFVDFPSVHFLVKGDDIVPQIMAASIVAKVTRDRIMIAYENEFPEYGFERHKGYGTKLHSSMLHIKGVLGIHRKSYKPIKLATY